jgi:hypothetical protein
VCPKANNSAIRAYKLHENARKRLLGEGEETAPSIFFISLLVLLCYKMKCSFEDVSDEFYPGIDGYYTGGRDPDS